MILSATRAGPDSWERRDVLVGPPLTPSPARVLSEAGVLFAIAVNGEGKPSVNATFPWRSAYRHRAR